MPFLEKREPERQYLVEKNQVLKNKNSTLPLN